MYVEAAHSTPGWPKPRQTLSANGCNTPTSRKTEPIPSRVGRAVLVAKPDHPVIATDVVAIESPQVAVLSAAP